MILVFAHKRVALEYPGGGVRHDRGIRGIVWTSHLGNGVIEALNRFMMAHQLAIAAGDAWDVISFLAMLTCLSNIEEVQHHVICCGANA